MSESQEPTQSLVDFMGGVQQRYDAIHQVGKPPLPAVITPEEKPADPPDLFDRRFNAVKTEISRIANTRARVLLKGELEELKNRVRSAFDEHGTI